MKDTCIHNLVNRNLQYLSADEIIRTLKNKFWSLEEQGLWSTTESKKLDTEGDMDVLRLSMKNLTELQKRGHTGRNGQYQDGKARYLIGITCFQCHKKVHFQDNCL